MGHGRLPGRLLLLSVVTLTGGSRLSDTALAGCFLTPGTLRPLRDVSLEAKACLCFSKASCEAGTKRRVRSDVKPKAGEKPPEAFFEPRRR